MVDIFKLSSTVSINFVCIGAPSVIDVNTESCQSHVLWQRNSLIEDVMGETGLCKDVCTTVTPLPIAIPVRPDISQEPP